MLMKIRQPINRYCFCICTTCTCSTCTCSTCTFLCKVAVHKASILYMSACVCVCVCVCYRSSSEDSEDNDPVSWQLHREHFKTSLSMIPLAIPSGTIKEDKGTVVDVSPVDSSLYVSQALSGQSKAGIGSALTTDQKSIPKSALKSGTCKSTSKGVSAPTPRPGPNKHLRRKKFQGRSETSTETQKSGTLFSQSGRERKPSTSSLSEDDVFVS